MTPTRDEITLRKLAPAFNELWIRHTDGCVLQPDGYDAFGIDDYHGDLDLTGLALGATVAVEMNETHTIYIIRVA
jgi:hypothetical protein